MLTQNPWTKDAAALIARVVVGLAFVAHGAQKLFEWGLSGTAEAFAGMGVPAPQLSATVVALVELVGGAALLLGAATPVAGALLVLDMLGAFVLVHVGQGVFIDNNGWELVAALGATALLLATHGAGRFSVDQLLRSRSRARTGSREPVAVS